MFFLIRRKKVTNSVPILYAKLGESLYKSVQW